MVAEKTIKMYKGQNRHEISIEELQSEIAKCL